MARRPSSRGRASHRWRAGLARTLELPAEIMLDLPRLLWLGGESLTVENHRGILEYTPDRIRIRVRSGQVIVEGARLEIERMTDSDIVLRGGLRSVHMELGPEGIHE